MRMDELQAAFLSVKLKKLAYWTKQRQEIALQYNELLKEIPGLILPKLAENASHVYHLYVIRTKRRNELQNYLAENGIGSMIHYPIPPHLQKAYAHLGFTKGAFPIAEELADTMLSLPIWPGMEINSVLEITRAINQFQSVIE
jgi:dTDP-4-amino-4,6-dideoxygalactose transaminase